MSAENTQGQDTNRESVRNQVFELWYRGLPADEESLSASNLAPLSHELTATLSEGNENFVLRALSNPNRYVRAHAARYTACYYFERGMPEKGKAFISLLEGRPEIDPDVLDWIRELAAKSQVLTRPDEAIGLCQKHETPGKRARSLMTLLNTVWHNTLICGKVVKAIMDELEASPISEDLSIDCTRRDFSEYLAKHSLPTDALAVTHLIYNPNIKSQAFRGILFQVKDFEKEKDIASRVLEEAIELQVADTATLTCFVLKLKTPEEVQSWLATYSTTRNTCDATVLTQIQGLSIEKLRILSPLLLGRCSYDFGVTENDVKNLAVELDRAGMVDFVDKFFPPSITKFRVKSFLENGKLAEAQERLALIQPQKAQELLAGILTSWHTR